MKLTNPYHGTECTIIPRADNTISAATYRRARRTLCPVSGCACFVSMASGNAGTLLGGAYPIYKGNTIVSYHIWEDME